MEVAYYLPRVIYTAICKCGVTEDITDFGRVSETFALAHGDHGIHIESTTDYPHGRTAITQDILLPPLDPAGQVHPENSPLH